MARSIRDYTDSERVNSLSWNAEIFFARLLIKADDFGSFYANPLLLKAQLFPLKANSIREADVIRWLAECEKSGLIVKYESNGKPLLRIINYGQRLRKMVRRFPDPPDEVMKIHFPQQLAAICGQCPPEEEEELEEKKNSKKNSKGKNSRDIIFNDLFFLLKPLQKKYFPEDVLKWKKAFDSMAAKKLPEKQHEIQDEIIFNKFIKKPIMDEIERMWNWYHKSDAHKKIEDWNAAMLSWLDKKGDFKR